ncbi:hypothetical protein DFH09DRAFT_845153, partial [Mycena vulgaris]
LTFASLYSDKKTREAFTQLFTELFDTIHQVTGKQLKLARFFPDANCRVIVLDGEFPQAQGLADFLATYNDPSISNIFSRTPEDMLGSCLITILNGNCAPYLACHIDELPIYIPKPTIQCLKSIMGYNSKKEIDAWHKFCRAQTDPAINNWYPHKLANPWILPSVNKFLSKISTANWDITPHHSNYVETAHARRNAETAIHVQLLTGI